ncbi:MAG: hypothetical protein E7393_01630 [Ruminococcaceae bacterium]|nr:hypothetical protein [Oscillospiraceae bacterium]
MRKQYKQRRAKSSGNPKALLVVGVLLLLVVLFFLSFWITGMVLKANQQPYLPEQGGVAATATPKPSYEDLEKMIIEKENKIKSLQAELDEYRRGALASSSVPAITAKPTVEPTTIPTVAPTVAPVATPQSTPAVTQTPAQATSMEVTE